MTPGELKAISIIERLLSLQLVSHYERLQDVFSELMTNHVAAGYVFGFHDSALQIFGLLDRNNAAAGFDLIETSYQSIFGDKAGFTLFNMSLHNLDESEFDIGRVSGGEDFFDFKHKKIPPLGLSRIVCLGFDAAAVARGLKGPKEDTKP